MTDGELADSLAQFYDDPLGYVMFVFPWDTEKSIQLVKLDPKYRDRFDSEYGPDVWACEFLDDLGEQIRARGFDGEKRVPAIRAAVSGGHGVGKTATVAWLTKFIMDTRPDAAGLVSASTSEILAKTWAEVGKWHKMSLTAHWFDFSDRVFCRRWGSEKLYSRCYPVRVSGGVEGFAGFGKWYSTGFYLVDEASSVPPKVFEVMEGGLGDGEPWQVLLGCPLRSSGGFYDALRNPAYLRKTVDSRHVGITNKAVVQAFVNEFGEESDLVRTRVKGLPPAAKP